MLCTGPGIGYCDLDSPRTSCVGICFYMENTMSQGNLTWNEPIGRRPGMGEEMKCLLFRRRGSSSMKKRPGYCEIDDQNATCEGDVSFCEKPDAFREYFRKKLEGLKKREKEKNEK